jgi:hypothetical protein
MRIGVVAHMSTMYHRQQILLPIRSKSHLDLIRHSPLTARWRPLGGNTTLSPRAIVRTPTKYRTVLLESRSQSATSAAAKKSTSDCSHVTKRSALIFWLRVFRAGSTLQQPPSCRKKNSACESSASCTSTRTYRLLSGPVRPNTVTRIDLARCGVNHFSTCERRDCALVALMTHSTARL